MTNVVKNIQLFLAKRYLQPFIALIIILLFIPAIDPSSDVGLDPSYGWAFNWLFQYNYDALTHIIYPYGVLGFIKNPMVVGSNILLFYLAELSIRFVFSFLFLRLSAKNTINIIVSIIVVSFINSYFMLDIFIYGIFLLAFLAGETWHHIKSFAALAVLLGFSLCVKFNIGFNVFACSVLFFAAYLYSGKLPLKEKLLGIALFYGTAFLIGSLLYKGAFNFLHYCYGTYQLSKGYNDAMSLEVANNWTMLSIYIVCIAGVLFLLYKKNGFYIIPLVIFLFLNYKHSFVREDAGHYYNIVHATLFTALITIIININKLAHVLLFTGALISISWNGISNGAFSNYEQFIPTFSFNFYKTMVLKNGYLDSCRIVTEANFAKSKINDTLRQRIGNQNIDCYPWELTYIPANEFNYFPRKTLQSGANCSWLDGVSKRSIEENKTPFYLFHSTNPRTNFYFGSIDGRYLLNDEPQTIYYLMNRYNAVYKDNAFTLLELQNNGNFSREKEYLNGEASLNQWIDVPVTDSNFYYRFRVNFEGKLFTKIRAVLYRPHQYSISYKFANDSTATFRFVKGNAADGLWISPFLLNFNSSLITKQIKISCSDSSATTQFKYTYTRFRGNTP